MHDVASDGSLPVQTSAKAVGPTSWLAVIQIAALRLTLMAAALASLMNWGAAAHLILFESPAPGSLDEPDRSTAILLALCSTAVTGYASWKLFQRQGREAIFFAVLIALTFVVSLLLAEFSARSFRPTWPASDLHGVFPRVGQVPWEHAQPTGDSASSNSWGQRDRERRLSPPDGIGRIGMIGDSFLEESIGPPLQIAVEDQIDTTRWEVVNLGVSATAPDEYYYRLKNVALPLGCDVCVMFIYLGNDLAADSRTLDSAIGIASVSPRRAFLSDIGLVGINHLLMNHRRPILKAWFEAGDLSAHEQRLHAQIRNATHEELVNILCQQSSLPPAAYQQLTAKLRQPEMLPFFDMLRNPDGGRFRSYYLADGVWLGATDTAPRVIADIDFTAHWVELSARHCAARDVRFLCVLIPDGFAVDTRMREQWSPLADMRQLSIKTTRAGEKLAARLALSGIEVLSLNDSLAEVPGTYLNMDGHWSDLGVKISAKAVAKVLADKFEIPLKRSAADAN